MFIPIGDSPNPPRTPYATYAIIGINVAIYALVSLPLGTIAPDLRDPAVEEYVRAMIPHLGDRVSLEVFLQSLSRYDLFVFDHGFRPAAPALTDLFFSLFLHANLAHLAGNMLFLWIYGDNVEHHVGSRRYVALYLATGIAASLFHALTALGSGIPTIGASGAISGVLGCYFIWFPRNAVRLMLLFPFMTVVLVPARLVLGLYIVADNLLPFLLANEMTGVAYGAHIGGFFAGLGVAWWSERRAVRTPPREYAPRAKVVPLRGDRGAAPAIAEAIAEGRFGEAALEYFDLRAAEAHRVLAPEDALQLAGWLRRNGHPQAALTVLRRVLRDYPQGPRRAEAHVAAGYLLLEDLGEPTAAYQHFLDALDLDPDPELAGIARQGVLTVEAKQKRQWGRPYRRAEQR
jgi:membrane associated rhomboid family serine protease